MKKIRLFALGIVLLTSAAALANAQQNSAKQPQSWYLVANGDPTDPGDYSSTSQGFNCSGGSTVCSIMAEADETGLKPDLSQGSVIDHQDEYSTTFRQ